MSAPLRIAVAGAGRMGQAIAANASRNSDTALVGIWTRDSDLDALLKSADVAIDFSLPMGTSAVIEAASRLQKPLVCGVTGLDSAQHASLDSAALTIPVVYDRNMSRGITVLNAILKDVGGALADDFAVSIAEAHHQHKKDSPSGTAIMLADTLARARGMSPEEIAIASERRGEISGEHTVIFESATECLTLSHSVTTRDVFAAGAISAARWVVARPAGRYSMQDVLFGCR